MITRLSLLFVLVVFSCNFALSAEPFATTASCALYAMDPAVRRLTGTIEQKLDLLKELGYSGLSRNGTDAADLRQTVAAAKARNLRVYALYVSCNVTTNSLVLPPNLEELCEAMSGTDAILWLYFESKIHTPSSIQADEFVAPALTVAARLAQRHSVRIAIYPHRSNWIETFADAIRISERVNHKNLGVSFNLCHSLAAGEEHEIDRLLRRAGEKLFMVTLNGADANSADAGWPRLIQPIGIGSFELGKLIHTLRRQKYTGPFGFQAHGIKGDPLSILSQSIAAWKGTCEK